MTRKELLKRLKEIKYDHSDDYELAHMEADKALMDFIADKEIKEAYYDIEKWYA